MEKSLTVEERIKKILYRCLCFILLLVFCGCSSSRYEKALMLYEDMEYEQALNIFLKIQDYEDSAQITLNLIDDYVNSLLRRKEYDKAIHLLEENSGLADFSGKIDHIKKYRTAQEYFADEKYAQGVNLLRELEAEFSNVKEILESYDKLNASPFIGKRTTTERGLTGSKYVMTIDIALKYSSGRFVLELDKTVKTTDGYLMTNTDYTIYADDIKNDTVSKGKYTWQMASGYLIETDVGRTFYYR